MAFLTVNAVSLDLAAGSSKRQWLAFGDRRRVASGALRTNEATEKRTWDCMTTPMKAADATAWSGLLRGRGHNFRFAAAGDYYSAKGLAGTASGAGTVTAGGSSGKFDKKVSFSASTRVLEWTPTGPDSLANDYTVMVWKWVTDAWKHYLIRNLAGSVTKYENAVTYGGSTDFLTVTAGVLKLNGADAGEFSDLVALPFAVPTSWISSLHGSTRAFPNSPRLELDADLVGDPSTPLEAFGKVDSEEIVPHVDADGEQLVGRKLSFSLEEA